MGNNIVIQRGSALPKNGMDASFNSEINRMSTMINTIEAPENISLDFPVHGYTMHNSASPDTDMSCGDDNAMTDAHWKLINEPITSDEQTIDLLALLISGSGQENLPSIDDTAGKDELTRVEEENTQELDNVCENTEFTVQKSGFGDSKGSKRRKVLKFGPRNGQREILTSDKLNKKIPKGDIRRYIERDCNKCQPDNSYNNWINKREKELRRSGKDKKKRFNDSLKDMLRATEFWRKRHGADIDILQTGNGNVYENEELPPLQNFNKTPVMVGADVCTLYPSMDGIGSAELAAQSIRESGLEFKHINYQMLAIYLFLVIGNIGMSEAGLKHVVPQRKNKESKATSLF